MDDPKVNVAAVVAESALDAAVQLVMQLTNAKAVVLVIFRSAEEGGAVAVAGPQSMILQVPEMLHGLAERVRADQNKTTH